MNMKEIILCYQGEMVLKGLNKASFESTLAKILRYRVKSCGNFKVYRAQSTMYIEPLDEFADVDEAYRRVSKVFGLAALSRAVVCDKNFETICETAEAYLGDALRGVLGRDVEDEVVAVELAHEGLQLAGGLRHVDADHGRAVAVQDAGDLLADAPAGTGHEGDLPGEGAGPVGDLVGGHGEHAFAQVGGAGARHRSSSGVVNPAGTAYARQGAADPRANRSRAACRRVWRAR